MNPLFFRMGAFAALHYFVWPFLRDSVIWRKEPDQLENTWPQTILQTALYFLIVFFFFLVLLYQSQESMLYVPNQPFRYMKDNPERYRSPADRSLSFEDVRIKASDGTNLHGWLIYHPREPKSHDTVVFMHENAGNIGLRMDYFQMLHVYGKFNILCVAYRGYSESEGTPNENGIKLDAVAITKFAKQCPIIDTNRVFLFGRSLGGAVALHLVS